MNIKTQILVVLIVVLALLALIDMIRKNKLELKYALLWFVLGIGILIFCCFPALTVLLAQLTGISTPVNLLFFVGFCFSLVIIFSLTAAVSRLSGRVKRLTQEIALLRMEMQENGYEKNIQEESAGEVHCEEIL